MTYCPNYKIKEVFDGFNKMVVAFGGKAMTEEEFRDSDLRNQRQGSDYSAMECAYKVYNRNGGNFLDRTPDGKPSILYQTLLSHFNNDEKAALNAKANVYSDEFLKWFGNWIIPAMGIEDEDINIGEISKVVDDNGEPLIVWHGSDKVFEEFKHLKGTNAGDGFYFTSDKKYALNIVEYRKKKNIVLYPVYLKLIKPLLLEGIRSEIVDLNDFDFVYDEDEYRTHFGLYKKYSNLGQYDGIYGSDYFDEITIKKGLTPSTGKEYVVKFSSQAKHVENLGTFDPNNPNIYKLETKTFTPELQTFERCNLSDFLGQQLMEQMMLGKHVNVKSIIQNILSKGFVGGLNVDLAKVLSIHNIPVRLDYSLSNDVLATTYVEKNTGVPVIQINPNAILLVSNRYAAIALLHEAVHAVTVDAIRNAKTKEQIRFKELNSRIRSRLLQLYSKNNSLLGDYDNCLYALESDEEFAAVFITDPLARGMFVELARQASKNRPNFLNTVKNFINSIVQLFVNKTLFEQSDLDLLSLYENNFRAYLSGLNPITKESIPSNSKLHDLYNSIDELSAAKELVIDLTKELDFYEDYFDKYNLRLFNKDYNFKSILSRSEKDVASDPRYSDVIDSLKIRVNTLRTSDIDPKLRVSLINATKTLISLFENTNIPKYVAITSMLKFVIPQMLDDISKMKDLSYRQHVTSRDYMYNMHGNFGMYYNVADTLVKILTERINLNEMLREANKSLPADKQLTFDDIDNLILDINNLKSAADTGVKLAEQLLKIIVAGEKGILSTVGKSVGSIEMGEFLASINSENPVLPKDISWIWKHIGTADSSESESIRALSHIVKKALDAADNESLDRGIDLLKKAKALVRGEKVTDIYEEDERGRHTGYIIRDLNWGKFYNDYDKFMEGLNEELGLPKDNRVAPIDKDLLQKWNDARNKFLDEHCERKYISKYYELWNSIPQSVKESLDSYNIQINAITEGIKLQDGTIDYNKLTDDEWRELNRLWEAKALLRSDYNEYGQPRTPGEPDYEAAKALLNLYEHLYSGDQKKNEDAWNQARNKIIEECGGHNKYIEYIKNGKAEGFDHVKFEKWEARNTIWEYIEDEDGKPIIFEKINQLLNGEKPSYGKLYDALEKEYNDILKPYRDLRGIVNVLDMPDAVLNKLGDLSKQMKAIKRQVKANNPRLAQFLKQRAELYSLYFTYKRTDYFQSIYDQLSMRSYDPDTDMFDGFFLGGMLNKYGSVYWFDDDDSGNFQFNGFDFLSKSEAKDKLTYMKPTPGRGWMMKNDDNPYINKKFKKAIESGSADENTSYIPKRSLYDNSKAFSKFREYNEDGTKNKNYSKTLSDLRTETIKMMDDANKKQSNRVYTDKYLLPQVTGTLYKRMKRNPASVKMRIFFDWLKEKFGFKTAENDYSEIGSDQALDLVEDILGSQYKDELNKNAGKYPDGRQFRILPQYYTRRLLNPSSISADLVNIVQTYYHMSCGYEQRLKIKDDCESILDFIKTQQFRSNKITQFKEGVIDGDISNTYGMADKFLEMNLYDVKRKKTTWNFKLFLIDISKTASLVKRWTTAKNLGLNPKVAMVGFLTSMYNHIINAIVGQRYGKMNAFNAFLSVIGHVGKLLLHPGKHIVGESLSDDPLIVQTEYFGIANQRERKFAGTNRPWIIENFYRNSTYGFLSTVDFMTKSLIMKSVLMNYKFVDGKFISLDDIKMSKFHLGKDGVQKMKDKYKKAVSLNSVLKVKDRKLYVEDKYKQAWLECEGVVKNRIQKYAEAADGMPTDLQRAAITQSWLGAFVLIHRNYLPLMLQERFGNTVYDYDMQQYKNGQFKLFIDICIDIAKSGYIPGLIMGAIPGLAFGGGLIGAIGGMAIGAGIARKYRGNNPGLRNIYNKHFNDFSSEKAAIKSLMNRYFSRQVIAELSTYALIAFLVNFLCSCANDKKNKKKWWLQMIAYWGRAFQWEAYTPYRTNDLLNNIKTPSAATSVMDVTEEIANSANSAAESALVRFLYVFDQNSALFDPSYNVAYLNSIFKEVKRGNYKGFNEFEKGIVKSLPVHNLYEQVLNSKAKRLYMENQLYKGDF